MPTHPTRDDIDFLDGHWYANDPHDLYTWMRHNAPVYYDENSDCWAITKYADIMTVSKDPETFSSFKAPRPHGDPLPMMISMDDPGHLQRRKLVNKGFTPKRVRDKRAEIRSICDEIIDRVCEKGECDFVWDIAAPLPLILIGDMLGFERDMYDDLLRWSDDMMRGTTANDPEASELSMLAGMQFREYQMDVIADRKGKPPGDDLLSVLTYAEVDGDRLDDESIVQESLLILIGGDETTRHVISHGQLALMEHPDQMAKLSAYVEAGDDLRIERAVEELLRWVTPIKNMARTAMRDVELNGQHIPEGAQVLQMYPSANRDEDVFDDPFTFDLERDPNHHVAFGFGTHFCLGASLARLELKEMFSRVLTRLPDLQLAVAQNELEWRASNFIVGPEGMPVTFTPTERVNA